MKSTLALVALVLAPALAGPAVAVPQWVDVAKESGIDFFYWGEGLETTPAEYVGGGVCVADFDQDGFDDLFFTSSLLNQSALRARHDPRSEIYRGEPGGRFTDVSRGSGADLASWGLGCSVADYDGDGDLDLMANGHSESTLLRNDGPFRFTNVTLAANVSMLDKCAPFACFTTGSAWADVNRDSCLDLYLANYGNFSLDSVPIPTEWPGQENVYFESNCDGTFRDRSFELNLEDDPAWNHSRSFQPMWFDYDRDGDLDVFITADGAPDSLLRQEADGAFSQQAWAAGVADPRAGMGLEADDVDGDGWPDLFFTHYTLEENGFYVNDRDGTFTDRSGEGELGVNNPDIGWGTGFADFDHDGRKDIYAVNGHTYDYAPGAISLYPDGANMTRRLWLQLPNGSFDEATFEAGPGMSMKTSARGSALTDYDFDGDLDVVVENVYNQSANLLRASNVTGNWLLVQLRDPATPMNRFAVGAVVTVSAPAMPHAQHRILHAGASFLSQNSWNLHFGLATAPSADVTVRWPDGAVESWSGVAANRLVRLTRGAALPEEDTLAPRSTASVSGEARGEWWIAPATLAISAIDFGVTRVSGVARLEQSVCGGPWTEYAGPFALAEGRYDVRYRATDAAGNVEPERALVVNVDETPPTVAIALAGAERDGWFLEPPALAVLASDATSGVAAREAREGGAWRPADAPFTLDAIEGERAVEARAIDAAGWESGVASRAFRVDLAPPRSTLSLAGPALAREWGVAVTSETVLSIDASDGAGAGVARVERRAGQGPWTDDAGPFSLDGPDGERRVGYRAVDAVGRVEAARELVAFLDNERPPDFAAEPQAGFAYLPGARAPLPAPLPGARAFAAVAGPVEVRIVAEPDVSGVAWVRALVDGAERARAAGPTLAWWWEGESAGWHTLRFEAADGRGNVGARDVRVLVI